MAGLFLSPIKAKPGGWIADNGKQNSPTRGLNFIEVAFFLEKEIVIEFLFWGMSKSKAASVTKKFDLHGKSK